MIYQVAASGIYQVAASGNQSRIHLFSTSCLFFSHPAILYNLLQLWSLRYNLIARLICQFLLGKPNDTSVSSSSSKSIAILSDIGFCVIINYVLYIH